MLTLHCSPHWSIASRTWFTKRWIQISVRSTGSLKAISLQSTPTSTQNLPPSQHRRNISAIHWILCANFFLMSTATKLDKIMNFSTWVWRNQWKLAQCWNPFLNWISLFCISRLVISFGISTLTFFQRILFGNSSLWHLHCMKILDVLSFSKMRTQVREFPLKNQHFRPRTWGNRCPNTTCQVVQLCIALHLTPLEVRRFSPGSKSQLGEEILWKRNYRINFELK